MPFFIRYACLTAASILLVLAGSFCGPGNLTFEETIDGILSFYENGTAETIVWNIRAPRIAVSLLTGACLGLAGVLIQLSTRSPLGDPNLFGVGGGAAIFLSVSAAGLISIGGIGVFMGCVGSSLAVAMLFSSLVSSRDLSPMKLAFMGIAIGALTVSVSTSVISHGRVFPSQVIGLVGGSFSGSNWEIFSYLLLTFSFCLVISIGLSRKFHPIMLGDTLSRSLGVNPISTRYIAMALVGILTGAAVFAGGLIGFVGMICPHIGRKLFGNRPIHLVVSATFLGAIVTLGSDQIARLLLSPTEFPVGMATTIIGAPLMINVALKLK